MYPELPAAALDGLLPSKGDSVTSSKVQGTYTVIYSVDNEPMFFDVDSRNSIYPTGTRKRLLRPSSPQLFPDAIYLPLVYALWKLPPFMPSMTIHPQVFQFISRGADLMLPGVVLPPNGLDLLLNSRMAVVLSGSNIPVAVGMVPVTSHITSRAGMTGKGLLITHFFGDSLWKSGSRAVLANSSLACSENEEQEPGEHDMIALELSQCEIAQEEPLAGIEDEEKPMQEAAEAPLPDIVDLSKSANTEEHGVDKDSFEEMENLVTSSFLQALKRRLKDKDLPILASRFWSEYCLPCRQRGRELNLKQTSWKKLLPFLESQARDGLVCIHTTEQGVTSLVAVVRDHPRLESFRTLAVNQTAEADLHTAMEDELDPSKPIIQEFWTLHKKLDFLLVVLENVRTDSEATSSSAPPSLRDHLQIPDLARMFSKPQLNTMLRDYLQIRELNHPTDPKLVTLDLNLCNALYPGKAQPGDTTSKKELMEAFSKKLIPIQLVTVNGEVHVQKGAQVGSIKIIVESRGGSKIVSRLQGLHHFGLDLKEVSKRASKNFASSAGQDSDSTGHPELLLQGNLEKSGPTWLQQEFNIPAKYVSVEVKGNVAKKKR